MAHTLSQQSRVQDSNQGERPPFKIVVVYGGMGDLIRVDEVWSRLVARFKGKLQVVSRAWNFALLHDPQLRERAALHTAAADLIVFSASGKGHLPDHIRNWVNVWLPWKKGRGDALVAVLDEEPSVDATALPLHKYLRHTAEQTGMEFFCKAGL